MILFCFIVSGLLVDGCNTFIHIHCYITATTTKVREVILRDKNNSTGST